METETKCTVVLTGIFNEGGMETPEFKEYSERSNANGAAGGGVLIQKTLLSKI